MCNRSVSVSLESPVPFYKTQKSLIGVDDTLLSLLFVEFRASFNAVSMRSNIALVLSAYRETTINPNSLSQAL